MGNTILFYLESWFIMSKKKKNNPANDYVTPSPLADNAASRRINALNDDAESFEEREKEDFLEKALEREKMGLFRSIIQKQKDKWHQVQKHMDEMDNKKDKISYFLFYYRFSLLILTCVLSVCTFFTYEMITKKDCIYNCIVINDPYNTVLSERLEDSIETCITYDKKEEEPQVNLIATTIADSEVSYYGTDSGSQSIFYQLSCAMVDTLVSDQDVIEWFAADNNFCELEEVLPADLYEKVSPYIVNLTDANGESNAYAIDLSATKAFQETDTLFEKPVIAIVANSERVDESIAIIEQLFSE